MLSEKHINLSFSVSLSRVKLIIVTYVCFYYQVRVCETCFDKLRQKDSSTAKETGAEGKTKTNEETKPVAAGPATKVFCSYHWSFKKLLLSKCLFQEEDLKRREEEELALAIAISESEKEEEDRKRRVRFWFY